METRLLTPLELKVMHILWRLKKAFVKEIIEEWPDKDIPAYNTVSTIVTILKKKEFVSHESFGRSYQYFPLVSRSQYQKRHITSVLNNVFSGSLNGLVSTLLNEKELSHEDIDSLKKLIKDSEAE